MIYYLMTEDDHEVRELSHGRVPERVQLMCQTLLDWESDEILRTRAMENQQRAKAPKPTRKKKAERFTEITTGDR